VKRASHGPHGSTASLVLVALFFGLGQNIIKPVIAPQAVALGGDTFAAGLVVAAQGVGGFLVALPIGALMARVGGQRIASAGTVVFVIGAALMVVATTPLVLGAGHFLFGAGGVGAWLAAQTMATVAVDDSEARRRIARVSTAALIGLLAGPPLGGLLTDRLDVTAAFVASLVAGLLLLPVLLSLPHHRRDVSDGMSTAVDDLPSSRRQLIGLWSRPAVGATLLTSCIAQILQTIRQSFLPLHLDGLGWTATQIGFVLSVAGIGALASRGAFTVMDRRLGTPALIAICLLPGALTLGTAVSSSAAAVVLVSVLISGFSLGLAQPVTLLALARATSERERGRAVGLRVFGNRFVQAAAPAAFGAVAALTGLVPAFWGFAVACAVAGVAVSRRPVAPPRARGLSQFGN
jgi:MFS family permease